MKYLPYLLLLVPAAASANPKKLPYSYGTQTMHEGGLELENYVDLVPMRVFREKDDGTLEGVWSTRYQLQTEMEYGLTDRVELGAYLVWRQGASANTPFLRFQGIKQRARVRVSDPTWPVGVAVYGEIAELYNEVELEEKVLVSWHDGPLELVANLWIEQEYYFADSVWEHIYNPTVGASWELSPSATVGLEYWARGRFDNPEMSTTEDDAETGAKTRHYAGPTLSVQRGEYWMSVGAYLRVDTADIAIGDPYGRFWGRLIIGIGL